MFKFPKSFQFVQSKLNSICVHGNLLLYLWQKTASTGLLSGLSFLFSLLLSPSPSLFYNAIWWKNHKTPCPVELPTFLILLHCSSILWNTFLISLYSHKLVRRSETSTRFKFSLTLVRSFMEDVVASSAHSRILRALTRRWGQPNTTPSAHPGMVSVTSFSRRRWQCEQCFATAPVLLLCQNSHGTQDTTLLGSQAAHERPWEVFQLSSENVSAEFQPWRPDRWTGLPDFKLRELSYTFTTTTEQRKTACSALLSRIYQQN